MIPLTLNGRTTRWQFFLGALCLFALTCVPVLFGIMLAYAWVAGNVAGIVGAGGLFALTAAGYLWVSLALHVRRIRDIGWDPLLVIVIWVAAQVLDVALAWRVPGLAVSEHALTTGFGGCVHTGLSLCLMFWPSAPETTHHEPPAALPPRPRRLETLIRTGGSRAPISGTFGRR